MSLIDKTVIEPLATAETNVIAKAITDLKVTFESLLDGYSIIINVVKKEK